MCPEITKLKISDLVYHNIIAGKVNLVVELNIAIARI